MDNANEDSIWKDAYDDGRLTKAEYEFIMGNPVARMETAEILIRAELEKIHNEIARTDEEIFERYHALEELMLEFNSATILALGGVLGKNLKVEGN